jgi:hypothetical protein
LDEQRLVQIHADRGGVSDRRFFGAVANLNLSLWPIDAIKRADQPVFPGLFPDFGPGD